MEGLTIRVAREPDLQAIDRIYDHYVRATTSTFQVEPAGLAAREAWFSSHGERWPVLVAETGETIVGWGSLSAYSTREGYRLTVEDSVYVDDAARGRGVGKAILGELLDRGRALGHHTVIAVISGDQRPSVRLHERFGFAEVGRMREVGWKFGQWLDVIVMQKML